MNSEEQKAYDLAVENHERAMARAAELEREVAELKSQPAPAGDDAERAAFEAWMHTYDSPPDLEGEIFNDHRYPDSECFGKFVYDSRETQRCWSAWQARAALAQPTARAALRYTNDGELAECPCCGSLDVGGAHDTVKCYGCGLQITKPRPLKNAADAWNKRAALAQSERVAEGKVLVDRQVVEFLQGKSELQGMHFGDRLPKMPAYWWRAYLPKIAATSPSKQGGV